MPWQVVKREDTFEGSDRPFISIATAHIAFNAMFARIAQINSKHRVTIYADPEDFCLGFEFHAENRPNSLALSSQASRGDGVFCAAQGIMNQHAWVKALTALSVKDRRFYDPKRAGQKWVIQLCPAFEVRRARESADIPSDAVGVYRYKRENGEVVYIGRGEIKRRLDSPERREWDFDVVEYSIVKDPDEQIKWESYWLERFEEANGKLPFYNKVAGFSKD